MNELDIILKVKTDLEKSMKQAETALKKLETETDKSTKKMEGSFKNVGNAIQAVMGSAIIKVGMDTIKSSEKMAIGFEILKIKSADVAGQLERASEISFGLANKFDLVNSANKALSFGIDLSNGRLEKLIKLASKTALVMGTDTKSAFDDLITGVARESKMILDNLGVMVNLNDVYSKYAETIGTTAKELTKQQRQTALLDEVNKQLAKSTSKVTDEMVKQGTAGTKAFKELETAMKSFASVGVQSFITLGKAMGATIGMMTRGEFLENWKAGMQELLGLNKQAGVKIITLHQAINARRKKLGLSPMEFFFPETSPSFEDEKVNKQVATIKRVNRKIREKLAKEMVFTVQDFDPFGLGDADDNFDKYIARLDKQARELQNIKLDTDNAILELAERNAEQRKIIAMDEYRARKKLEEKEREEKLKHFNLLKRFGSEYLNAIIAGNAEKIPEILAQQAQMFGQELIWDGIKTLWMGTAKNALFPGLGASATAVGATEIAIGTGMVAGGMALSSATSANSDSGAGERNSMAKSDKEYNLNMEVSLFGSKTQAKRRLNDLMVG